MHSPQFDVNSNITATLKGVRRQDEISIELAE